MNQQVKVTLFWNGNGSEDGFESILAQTLTDIEILLNEQPDASVTDKRVKFGCEPAGQYIMYVQPPCVFELSALETMVAYAERVHAGICICGRRVKAEKRAITTCDAVSVQQKRALLIRLIKKNLLLTSNNTLLRKGSTTDAITLFAEQFASSPVVCLSLALVLMDEEPARVKACDGISLLGSVLERGAMEQ